MEVQKRSTGGRSDACTCTAYGCNVLSHEVKFIAPKQQLLTWDGDLHLPHIQTDIDIVDIDIEMFVLAFKTSSFSNLLFVLGR